MKVLVLIAIAIISVKGFSVHQRWNQFKVEYNKNYKNLGEEKHRFEVFQNNLKEINEHNSRYQQGLETYYKGVNKFTDLTKEEFVKKFKSSVHPRRPRTTAENLATDPPAEAPEFIDWRNKNVVTEVKNREADKVPPCISASWAFSVTGVLESHNAIKNNKLVSLSEQQLLDCDTEWNNGCWLGYQTDAYEYVVKNGLNTEEEYPYEARNTTCRAKNSSSITIKGYKAVGASEDDLKVAVGTLGPIAASMNIDELQSYAGGIYGNDKCFSVYQDEGVLVVGYDVENNMDYWIIKLSFGKDWGENGYLRLLRNAGNQCGIASDCSYPVL